MAKSKPNVLATKQILSKYNEYKQLKQKIDLLNLTVKPLKAELEEFIGESENLLSPDGQQIIATYKERAGAPQFDKESFKTDHPKLFDQYQKPGTSFKVLMLK